MTKDIVERLREASGYALMDNARVTVLEAADEIADLRFALRQATDRASLAEVKCSQLLEAGRLTDAEREAVDTAEASLMRESTDLNTPLPVRQRLGAAAATLRGLLERLGGHQ
jgi:hypothetical protein